MCFLNVGILTLLFLMMKNRMAALVVFPIFSSALVVRILKRLYQTL